MRDVISKFSDGGPFFTYTIFIILIIVIALFISAFLRKKDYNKTISLMSSFAWFAVAWGFLGRTFGLIMAFDNVSAHGELTLSLLAEGLKMALLDPLFGIMVFLVARAGIIILTWIQKDKEISI
ncbi:MotA/TolQ/ExbB proton channel family protein [Bacteroidota bacterium]